MEEYSTRTGWNNPTAIDKLAPAVIKAQGMIEGALKDSNNPHFKSKYADLSSVWAAIKPALQACGLGVLQPLTEAPPGYVGIYTVLVHESGQSISSKSLLPFKDAQNPQAAGSAITYARRYALSSLLGVCPEDDDGNSATKATPPPKAPKPEPTTVERIRAIQEAFEKASEPRKKELFMQARNSSLPEPEKTELLTRMGKELKK